MKVNQLVIQNFRGIEDLTLDFGDRNLIVLIGINGSGKSSILDCLAILLSWLIAKIQFPKRIRSSVLTSLRGEKNPSDGNYLSEQDIKNQTDRTFCKIIISLDGSEFYDWNISKERTDNSDKAKIDESKSLYRIGNKIHNELQNNALFDVPLAVYYPVKRTVEEISLKAKEKYVFKQTEAYDGALEGVQISFKNFFEWFRTIEDWENEKRRDDFNYIDKQLEAVRKSIYSLLGEDFSDLRVRRNPLVMTVKKQNEELIVNQLSDGEKSLLAMTGDLARRLAIANPSLSDPCQASAVVLIDEIEQHLHPSWQRKIIPALRRTFPNCQFIITTHSPQVLSQVHKEDIFVLDCSLGSAMSHAPHNPSSIPDYPPAPSGSQTMPYRRDGTASSSEDKLLDLCIRAVEAKLLYYCGQSTPYPSIDFSKSTDTIPAIAPTPAKPWVVRAKHDGEEQYFTADELRTYLTDLLRNN